jgi:hypothetical protein
VKLGNPLPNPVITNQVQHAIRDRPQAACKPCRTPPTTRQPGLLWHRRARHGYTIASTERTEPEAPT